MMWKEWIFKYRGYLPVIPCLVLILFSNPSQKAAITSLLLVVFGEATRIFSVAYTGGKTRSNRTNADRLITDGPYSRVRNPIYIGNFFIGLGLVFLFNVWMPYILLIYVPLFLFEYGTIISVEESFLFSKFGDEYRRYRQSVSSILPLCKRYKGEKVIPSFIGAFKSERDTFITIFVVYLLTFIVWCLNTNISNRLMSRM
jgi:protein-S-isoprenylcysteine O-methyltransferase Ste14